MRFRNFAILEEVINMPQDHHKGEMVRGEHLAARLIALGRGRPAVPGECCKGRELAASYKDVVGGPWRA